MKKNAILGNYTMPKTKHVPTYVSYLSKNVSKIIIDTKRRVDERNSYA